ncbi:cache domain-containing protein [Methanotorris formicicus]|uniref:Single cache domain-containing protein n=1 Tax=Methanotorris formicicus Mc-S-70 TaxID=647171 RepID=H1KZ29_9EURY|nr:cache domain-containing protein [Methanotorris formicicus]EHP86454.1 hypothetical protein MetfoDRAFT_1052 [Methanotorris formicicus Mc-S-70]
MSIRRIRSPLLKRVVLLCILGVIFSGLGVGGITLASFVEYIKEHMVEDVGNNLKLLKYVLENRKKEMGKYVYFYSEEMNKYDKEVIIQKINYYSSLENYDIFAWVDSNGNIIYDVHGNRGHICISNFVDVTGDYVVVNKDFMKTFGYENRCIDGKALLIMSVYPLKGGYLIAADVLNKNNKIFEGIKYSTYVDFTIFANNVRITTTIKNRSGMAIVGTMADPKVVKEVLIGGGTYEDIADINGKTYITRYEPLVDKNGHVVGMIATAINVDKFYEIINNLMIKILIIIIMVSAIVLIIVIGFMRGIVNKLDEYIELTITYMEKKNKK